MMKCSFDVGRSGSDSHNDRTTTDNSTHINHEKSSQNIYYDCVNDKYYTHEDIQNGTVRFSDITRDFYVQRYSSTIEKQNARNEASGHAKRNKTIDDYLKDDKTKPYRIILQIGNRDNQGQLSQEHAKEIMEYQVEQMRELYPNFHAISYAIHYDESTPHLHLTAIFDYEKDGVPVINQTQALKEMGFEKPNIDEKTSKFNNPLITWTRDVRERFEELCKECSIDIDTERVPTKRNQSMEDVIYEKNKNLMEENKRLEKEISSFRDKIDSLKFTFNSWLEKISDRKKYLENFYGEVVKVRVDELPYCQEYARLSEDEKDIEELITELDDYELEL